MSTSTFSEYLEAWQQKNPQVILTEELEYNIFLSWLQSELQILYSALASCGEQCATEPLLEAVDALLGEVFTRRIHLI